MRQVFRCFPMRVDTFDAFADKVVSREPPDEEESPMRVEKTVTVYQATLRDAIAGIHGLIKNAVTDMVTTEGHNVVKWTGNRLQAMLQRLSNKTLDEKLISVEFECRLLQKIDEATTSHRPMTKMTEAVLDNHNFIASVETLSRRKPKRAWRSDQNGKIHPKKF